MKQNSKKYTSEYVFKKRIGMLLDALELANADELTIKYCKKFIWSIFDDLVEHDLIKAKNNFKVRVKNDEDNKYNK